MNRQKFLKSLNALSGWRESAFMLALAERAVPNAQLYVENSVAEPREVVRHAHGVDSLMTESWEVLIVEPNEEAIIQLLDHLTASYPDLEQDDSYGALPAGDCLWVWEQALVSGINQDKKRAVEVSQRSLETITQFLEFSEGQQLSEGQLIKLFDNHALIEREFSFQQELSERLRSARHPGDELIVELRELAQDEGVSNIGISLD